MIAMTTPVITYTTEPDPLLMLASSLWLDTGPLIYVALFTSTDTEASWGIEVIPSSASDEVLPTWFLASDEWIQVISKSQIYIITVAW